MEACGSGCEAGLDEALSVVCSLRRIQLAPVHGMLPFLSPFCFSHLGKKKKIVSLRFSIILHGGIDYSTTCIDVYFFVKYCLSGLVETSVTDPVSEMLFISDYIRIKDN